jgi:hypothetical protein
MTSIGCCDATLSEGDYLLAFYFNLNEVINCESAVLRSLNAIPISCYMYVWQWRSKMDAAEYQRFVDG